MVGLLLSSSDIVQIELNGVGNDQQLFKKSPNAHHSWLQSTRGWTLTIMHLSIFKVSSEKSINLNNKLLLNTEIYLIKTI